MGVVLHHDHEERLLVLGGDEARAPLLHSPREVLAVLCNVRVR